MKQTTVQIRAKGVKPPTGLQRRRLLLSVIVQGEVYPFELQNIVTSCDNISDFLDLEYIKEHVPQANYNPTVFPGLSIRLYEPWVTLSMFKSGKVNCTGAKSMEETRSAFTQFRQLLEDIGVPFDPTFESRVKVYNMVTVFKLGGSVNLEKIYNYMPVDKVEYEPESFPGLVLKVNLKPGERVTPEFLMTESFETYENQAKGDTQSIQRITSLIFYSGKIVVTGFKEIPKLKEYIIALISWIITNGLVLQ